MPRCMQSSPLPPGRRGAGILASLVIALLLSGGAAAFAAEPPAAIREIVQTCAACHGQNGVSEIEKTPSLAAQPDIFIQYQLVFIRDGQRQVEVMQQIAKQLTDQNIRDLGAYYSSLPPPPARTDAGK